MAQKDLVKHIFTKMTMERQVLRGENNNKTAALEPTQQDFTVCWLHSFFEDRGGLCVL